MQQLESGSERVGGATLEPAQTAGAATGEHGAAGQRSVKQLSLLAPFFDRGPSFVAAGHEVVTVVRTAGSELAST